MKQKLGESSELWCIHHHQQRADTQKCNRSSSTMCRRGQGLELLRDIHQGECDQHASATAIVAKAFRHDFYWSTARAAAEHLVKHCNGCQRFKAKSHLPVQHSKQSQ